MMAAKAAHVLPPPMSAAAAVAVAIVSVVVVWLAAVAPAVSGGGVGAPVVGMPLLMAARGGGGGGRRVEDEAALEMDSEAHRRVVLVLRGEGDPSPGNKALYREKPWCDRTCPAKPGQPYVPDPRPCLKIYQCPGGTVSSLSD